MANDGKTWEGIVKSTLKQSPDISVDRLPDPMMGYKGVRNICDFVVYKKPNQFYIECKATRGNTLNFSAITKDQWEGLLEKSTIPGVLSVVLIWFSEHDTVVALDIGYLKEIRDAGFKSFNVKWVSQTEHSEQLRQGWSEIECVVPRVNPKVDLEDLVGNLDKLVSRR